MNLGYMAKPYDSNTGLYNYGYRDYKPEAARFTTVDPIRDGSNWFVYVNNDPVNYVDLWGLSAGDGKNKDYSEVKTFHYTQPAYAFIEGLGIGASYNVNGYVNIEVNEDGKYTATVSATGNSALVSNAGNVNYTGYVDVNVNGKTIDSKALSEPTSPYLIDANNTMIGTATVNLPNPNETDNVSLDLHVSYALTAPEGKYVSPGLQREISVFQGTKK